MGVDITFEVSFPYLQFQAHLEEWLNARIGVNTVFTASMNPINNPLQENIAFTTRLVLD